VHDCLSDAEYFEKIETVPAKEFGTCRVREGFWVDCLPDKDTHTKVLLE
jgi:hypothetical protein